jgi:serine protease Do
MGKDSLQQLDDSVVSLVQQVSPAVVQILVTGYGTVEQRGQAALIGHQRTLGSGVIVDPEGYIMTNAHVVQGAERVRVVLFTSENSNSPHATLRSKTTTMEARVLGVETDVDLALLKIEASGLPSLPLGRYRDVRQGQLVFAFGSPEGLGNSVTMGVVSSVARCSGPEFVSLDGPEFVARGAWARIRVTRCSQRHERACLTRHRRQTSGTSCLSDPRESHVAH